MTQYDDYGIPIAYSEPESLTHQAWRLARAFYLYRIRPFAVGHTSALKRREWNFRRLFSLANVLVVIWWVVLYWGEKGVFNSTIESCNWDAWEKWEPGANPHRLIFVADPQLIDPHTYPGRPWPLNPLAYKYTDLYLRRTYSRLQTVLYPDTIFFLGDLFDGGREWSTRTTKSPHKEYHRYGQDYWLNEYRRFGNIFFRHWGDAGLDPRKGQPGRKLISSLPGNHDLGFARGVQVGVRDRFNAYFGDGNRIDIIANHTFVSIDSLSLSALGQESPEQVQDLWRPTVDFLDTAAKQKTRLVQRELRKQQGLRPYPPFPHKSYTGAELAKAELPHSTAKVTDFPTILLTHIPLFRAPGTPCGPQREHWPPTPADPPLENDPRNAISVSGGEQYQNVLNKEITVDIANKIGDIQYAFSGDDHDYCEVLHRGYASGGGGIKEITVKSTSWAMGVRHPGVVLASLWNPVDETGKPLNSNEATIQTHLCLYPDQIGTFIRYGTLFGITVILLAIRAALITTGYLKLPDTTSSDNDNVPLLPTSEKDIPKDDPASTTHSSNSSTSSDHAGSLQVRSTTARTRSVSPNTYSLPQPQARNPASTHRHTYPLIDHAGYFGPPPGDEDRDHPSRKKVRVYGSSVRRKPAKKRKGFGLFVYELRRAVLWVVLLGGPWYVWLVWGDRY